MTSEIPIVDTPYPPYGMVNGIRQVFQDIRALTRRKKSEPPFLLALSDYTNVAFYPNGYSSPPVLVRLDTITDKGEKAKAVVVDYWVDGNPHAASGIMHRESVALIRDEEGIRAYSYSKPLDRKGESIIITSSDKRFRKEADKLWGAIDKAAALTLQQLPNIYSDHRYDFNQIIASGALLDRLVRVMHGKPEYSEMSSPPLSRRMGTTRTAHTVSQARGRAA